MSNNPGKFTEYSTSLKAWLQALWGKRLGEVGQQYQAFQETCPLVMADLAKFCQAMDTSVVPGDPNMTHVNEGKRLVFLHICENVGVDPAEIEQWIKEIE